MRALRVLGIAEDGEQLVCADVERADGTAETFTLPLDDRLRAAVRGDLSRFGQLEIEMAPQLRPKEIQSRIRAGASIEQVAAAAGCAPERIDRYAYPVLMERATVAERAQQVRPLQGAALGSTGAANADRTLAEIVSATLADRGQQQDLAWDAFRDERGWTVTVTWRAGRSENRAEWSYHAGPDGGSVVARDEAAADLVEPAPRPLRTIGDGRRKGGPKSDPRRGDSADRAGRSGDEDRGEHTRARRRSESVTADEPIGAAGAEAADGASEHQTSDSQTSASQTGRAAESHLVESLVESTVTDERAGVRSRNTDPADDPADDAAPGERSAAGAARTGTDDASAGGPRRAPAGSSGSNGNGSSGSRPSPSRAAQRGHRPPMPSWEDVLLGTRASGR